MMQTMELTDGGILLYDECFPPTRLSDRYFAELRDNCAWEHKPGIFGHMQPRLTASYGNEGITYRYSGTVNVALPWTPLLSIRPTSSQLSQRDRLPSDGSIKFERCPDNLNP